MNILSPTVSISQSWEWQNPLPFGDPIEKVFFVDNQHGWMAPENTTLLRTIDGGQNWEILYIDIMFNDIFFVDPMEGWGIGREQLEGTKNSIYHTTDGGLTWEVQLADTTVRYDIFLIDHLHGWATGGGAYGTLLYTNDGGRNWQRQAEGEFRIVDNIFGVTFLDTLKGWAVGGLLYGIYTEDGGQIWEKDSSLAGIQKVIYADSLHLWGISRGRKVCRTVDGGQTWEKIEITDTTEEVHATDIVAFDNDRVFVVTNLGIHKSVDGGRSWSLLSQQWMNSFYFLDSLEVWGGGVNRGTGTMLHSLDGGKTWDNLIHSDVPHGFDNLYSVDFVNSQTGWIIGDTPKRTGTGGFVLKTTDGGKTWFEQVSSTNHGLTNLNFVDELYGWVVGRGGKIIHTIDGGQSWIPLNSGTTITLWAIRFVDQRHGWVVGGDFVGNSVQGIILHTNDGGYTWIDQTPGIIPRLFDVSFVDSLRGWVVGGGGSVYDWGTILHTNDGGQTWITQRQHYGLELSGVEFVDKFHGWAIDYDPQTGARIIHTSDGGATWTGQHGIGTLKDIKFIDTQHGWVVGSWGKIFCTKDGGQTWTKQPSYACSRWLKGVDFVDKRTGWIVGDHGTILHTNNGGGTFVKTDYQRFIEPKGFRLYFNYPNPFNPETRIRFDILKLKGKARLVIFDVLGKKVATLFDGELVSGSNEFIWDGTDDQNLQVSSGIYFYRLEIDGKAEMRKMILLR